MSKWIAILMTLVLAMFTSTAFAWDWDAEVTAALSEPGIDNPDPVSNGDVSSYMYYAVYATAVGGEAFGNIWFNNSTEFFLEAYVFGSGEDGPYADVLADTSGISNVTVDAYAYVSPYGEVAYAYAKIYWGGK